jgi:hypothetical protein
LGFACRTLLISLEVFLESYYGWIVIYRLGRLLKEGGRLGDSAILRSRRLYLRSDLETSSRACGCPIYHPREFQVIWRPHSSRPNCWHFRVSGGSYQIRVSAFGGRGFCIWASYFRRGFPCPDLSLGGVWQHLEVFFRRVEPLVFILSQQDVPTT